MDERIEGPAPGGVEGIGAQPGGEEVAAECREELQWTPNAVEQGTDEPRPEFRRQRVAR